MRSIVVVGGNSGIGLAAARALAAQGQRVTIVGRDQAKGEAAVASTQGKASFVAGDVSTSAGVQALVQKLSSAVPDIDALLLGPGVLMTRDERTADDLHPVFAVNYLSRYHLTQRLLPVLKRSRAPKVVLLAAGVPLTTVVDFSTFPRFKPFPGLRALSAVQIANFHYVQHLAKAEPTVTAAVVNVGLVKTDIMRAMPAFFRVAFAVMSPLTISADEAAANPVALCTTDGWASGSYYPKPGQLKTVTPLALDVAVTERVVALSRELTGA